MATERQIAANRLNALQSRGPVTDEGKARSRRNALTHGLAGEGQVLAEALADQFDDRRDRWAREIQPRSDGADWALDRGVAASIQIEQCETALDALVVEQTSRARLTWDGDRKVEAATLMTKLAKSPMLVTCQLEATKQGAETMIAVWSRLGEANEANGAWSDAEAAVALDLLGMPADLRAGLTPLDVPTGADPAVHRRGLVINECSRLAGRISEALGKLDAIARTNAERSALVLLSPEASRLHRYQRDAWRRYRESMKAAKDGSSGAESMPEPEVATIPLVSSRSAEAAGYPAMVQSLKERLARAGSREERDAVMAEADELMARMEASHPELATTAVDEVEPSRTMNRQQRRAMAAMARKR
jgi:hypothetical protein